MATQQRPLPNRDSAKANVERTIEGIFQQEYQDWAFDPDIGSGVIPVVTPAVAGNLVELTSSGTLVDAGYTATTNAEPDSVVKRDGRGVIINYPTLPNNLPAASLTSRSGTTLILETESAERYVEFGELSCIMADTGILAFRGDNATTNRIEQLKELVSTLPTTDPEVLGEPWLNAGVLTFSQG